MSVLVKDLKHGSAVLFRMFKYPWVVIDTETVPKPPYGKRSDDALCFGRARIKTWAVCHRGEAYAFGTNLMSPEYPTMAEWAALLLPYAADPSVRKVFHNANYDVNVFWSSHGIKVFKNIYCTMIGAWAANEAIEKGLKSRAPLYGRHLQETSTVDFNNEQALTDYVTMDVIMTDELYQMQMYCCVERKGFITHLADAKGHTVVHKDTAPKQKFTIESETLNFFKRAWVELHELPYLRAVMRAERNGFPYDLKTHAKIKVQCASDKDKLGRDLMQAAGSKINLNSAKQVAAMFQANGVVCPYTTKKGAVSLSAAALTKMRGSHPLVDKLLEFNKIKKLQQVYIGGDLDKHGEEKQGLDYFVMPDGRIHCVLNTLGAVTGRGSAQLPNLTQIPSRADRYNLKANFCAPKGKKLICLDYAQLEIRIMAILCKDPEMARILCDPEGDIHTNTADQFGVDRNPTAKQLNFLMLYGGMCWMLAERLTLEGVPTTPEQAQAYIDRYNEVYYRVHEYRQELLQHHQEKGFVYLLTGRTRHLDDIDWDNRSSVHKAETTLSNNVVQGSGQDMLKASIIRTDPKCINPDSAILHRFGSRLKPDQVALLKDYARRTDKLRKLMKLAHCEWFIQVHDEVVYAVDTPAAEECLHAIGNTMSLQHFFPATTEYNIPLVADGGVGDTWKQAKSKPDGKNPPDFHGSFGFPKKAIRAKKRVLLAK